MSWKNLETFRLSPFFSVAGNIGTPIGAVFSNVLGSTSGRY